MCSKMQTRPQTRVSDRFGAVLTASMSVLFVEAVIGVIALLVWGQTRESPNLPHNALEVVFLIVVGPFVLTAGAVPGALLSVGGVMPLMAGAGWLGRRLSGREAWWWTPALAGVATALPTLAVAVFVEAGPWAALGAWFMVTTALAVAALVARRLLLPDRPYLSGGAMFGRVALYGTLAVVTAGTLAGIGLHAGIGYEPPRLSTEQVAGTWSDGEGGTLILAEDGKATATRVKTFAYDDAFEPVVQECTGTGTWEYDPGAGPWSQKVDLSVDGCSMDRWELYGTPAQPKMYAFVGDPDSWDLYTLKHQE